MVEVKGDQQNDQALRLSFLTGLGQLSIARARHPRVRLAYGLTGMYKPLTQKYADVIRRHRYDIIWA
jgi:hypothetical protein